MKLFYKIIFILILVNILPLYIKASTNKNIFNQEEKNWLKQHKEIRIGIMNNWAPMDYVDGNGLPRGIGVDFIGIINKYLDNRIKIVPGSWHIIYEKCKNKELDALMDITERKERKAYFNFTKPYVHVPHVIVALKNKSFYNSIKDLKGKILATEKKYGINIVIKNNYPTIKIKNYNSTNDALNAVNKGEADAYIGNRAVANYLIKKNFLYNLQIQGKITETFSKNSIGVRKDWEILANILDKILTIISDQERFSIYHRWGCIKSDISYKLNLTQSEKNWIKRNKKIVIAFDGDYAPYSYKTKSGSFEGIAVDFVNEISHRTGIKFKIYSNGTWANLYTAALNRKVDVVATLVKRKEREKFFNFTEPYLSLAQYIITLKKNSSIKNRDNIEGKKIALVKKYSTTKYILEDYPSVKPYYVNNLNEALYAVIFRKAIATVAPMGTAQHKIAQQGINNLKFAALYAQGLSEQRFGIRKDWPILASIIKKALKSIQHTNRHQIFLRWSLNEVAKVEIFDVQNEQVIKTEESNKLITNDFSHENKYDLLNFLKIFLSIFILVVFIFFGLHYYVKKIK